MIWGDPAGSLDVEVQRIQKKKAWNQDLDDGHMVVRFDKLFHRFSASMVVSSKCGLFLCKFGLDVLRQQHVSKENPLG